MKLFDSHSHINFKDFKDDYKDVIKRALDKEIGLLVCGSQYTTSRRAIEISEEFSDSPVFGAVGLHPIQLFDFLFDEQEANFQTRAEEFDYEAYTQMAKNPKVKAIGEIGLEYFHLDKIKINKKEAKEKQKKILTEQLKLAQELNLPALLHCRGSADSPNDAYLDLFEIIKVFPKIKGVMHCYSNFDLEILDKFLKTGLYFGFNGVITFYKPEKFKNIILGVPIERILLETDCPYLTPEPHRGKRNEPAYVEFVANKIAEILRMNVEDVSNQTVKNSRELFNL